MLLDFVIWSNFDRASAETMAEMVAIPVAILGLQLLDTPLNLANGVFAI